MSLIKIIFLFFWVIQTSFANTTVSAFVPPSGWKLKTQQKEMTIYEQGTSFITVTAGTLPESSKITKDNFHTEIEKSLKHRGLVNKLLGLTNWTVETSNFEEAQEKKIVTLKGSYQKDDQKFLFFEWQIRRNKQLSTLQIEFLQNNPIPDSDITKIYNSLNAL